jgi:hypothetical protein
MTASKVELSTGGGRSVCVPLLRNSGTSPGTWYAGYPGLGKVRPRVEAPEFHPEHGFDLADGRLVAKQAAAGATIRGVHR